MPCDRRLLVSAAANLVLTAGLVWAVTRPAQIGTVAPAARVASVAPAAVGGHVAPTPRAANDGDAEWPRWAAQLQAAGLPNRVIANTVIADFERRWERTQWKLQREFDAGEIDSETLARAQTDHDREKESELRQALGEAGFRAWQKETMLHAFTVAGVPMSEEESDRVYQLRRNDAEQRRRLGEAQQRGEIDGQDLTNQIAALDSDYQAGLRSVLGDTRVNALSPSNDGTEADVRRQLKRANLATDQITALADVQRARDILRNDLRDQKGRDPETGSTYEARRQAIDAARDQTYERILGPAAFAEWQKSSDPRYQAMQRYATAWQLNDADVSNVYAALQNQEQQTRQYRLQALAAERQGLPTDWTAVQNRIDALAQQTEQSLRQTLGEERFDRLKRNDILATHP